MTLYGLIRMTLVVWLTGAVSTPVIATEGPIDILGVCLDGDDAIIRWNTIGDNCGSFDEIIVYGRQNNTSPYQALGTLTDRSTLNFTHADARSFGTQWDYFLKVASDCNGDTLFSDTVKIDLSAPSSLIIFRATVEDGRGALYWRPSPVNDAFYYIIYNGESSEILDTIYNGNAGKYIDSVSGDNPAEAPLTYYVGVFDTCDNRSPVSPGHTTMQLTTSVDRCDRSIAFDWTDYLGWDVEGYDLYISKDSGQAYNEIEENVLPGYVLTNAEFGAEYAFYVRARNIDGLVSNSNVEYVSTNFSDIPEQFYLKRVTVIDSALNLEWYMNRRGGAEAFRIERSIGAGAFGAVGRIPIPSGGDTVFTYVDSSADVTEQFYRYRISALDDCDKPILTTNTSGNILMDASQNESDQVGYSSTPYFGWDAGTDAYELQRRIIETDSSFTDWETVVRAVTSFETPVADLEAEEASEVCYRVAAFEDTGNVYGFQDTSYSNVICQRPVVIFLNNTLVIGSDIPENRVFKPYMRNVIAEQSRLLIYNRWGQLQARVTDLETGWRGNGFAGLAEPGAYLYVFITYDRAGRRLEYTGTVHVFDTRIK